MREIKFRAWVDEEKRWLKSVILCPDGSVVEFDYPEDYTQLEYMDFEIRRRYYPGDIEVQQFTGLKDRNGKEIYEGDILKHQNPFTYELEVGEVYFSENGYFALKKGEDFVNLLNRLDAPEVIGNIYENPDLLEVKP